MKLVALQFLIPVMVSCQTLEITGPSIVVTWDPIFPDQYGGSYSYIVIWGDTTYLQEELGSVAAAFSSSMEVVEAKATIVFAKPAPYRIGVRTKRILNGVTFLSEYTWSDVDGFPEPWVAVYLDNPPRVRRIQLTKQAQQ